jgi:hypothetical protein
LASLARVDQQSQQDIQPILTNKLYHLLDHDEDFYKKFISKKLTLELKKYIGKNLDMCCTV